MPIFYIRANELAASLKLSTTPTDKIFEWSMLADNETNATNGFIGEFLVSTFTIPIPNFLKFVLNCSVDPHSFENVAALLYCASLSEYNQQLEEDPDVNRMLESLNLWEGICRYRWFDDTAIVLFLNKRDLVNNFLSFSSFHFISFHFISFHFISFHFISFHFISFHFILFFFVFFRLLIF